ncbi:hypothetical protein D9M72_387740 [compost metagenome]
MHRLAASQAHGGGPQRVVRGRDEHFVAVVEQSLHGHHDQLGDAVTEVDVLDAHAFDLLLLAVLHDRLARAEQALGITVALGGGQVADHILEDFLRGFETERRRIADVQLEDAMAFLFQTFGVPEHRSADVVADIGELVRFADLHDTWVSRVERVARGDGERCALAACNATARLASDESRMIRAARWSEKVGTGLFY